MAMAHKTAAVATVSVEEAWEAAAAGDDNGLVRGTTSCPDAAPVSELVLPFRRWMEFS